MDLMRLPPNALINEIEYGLSPANPAENYYSLDTSFSTLVLNGYCVPTVVVLTIITNVFVCFILLSKKLLTPTNVILASMAIIDTFTGLFPSIYYAYFYPTGDYKEWVPYSHCYTYYCFTFCLPSITHVAFIWLTVALAVHRYICIRFGQQNRQGCFNCQDVRPAILTVLMVTLAAAACNVQRFFELKFEPRMVPPRELFELTGETDEGTDVRVHLLSLDTSLMFQPMITVESKNMAPMVKSNTTKAVRFENENQSMVEACVAKYADFVEKNISMYFSVYNWLRVFFVHLIPCVLLIVLNALLIKTMRSAAARHTKMHNVNSEGNKSSRVSETNKTTLMLVIVVALVVVVEIPEGILSMLIATEGTMDRKESPLNGHAFNMALSLFNFLVILSYPLHFFIYCAMSGKFRSSFVGLFKRAPDSVTDTTTKKTYV